MGTKRGRLIEDEERFEMETRSGRLIEEDDDSEFLPPEINTEILSRLPADSAIECRCICKLWRSLIDHPVFRDTHTRQLISSSTSNPNRFGNYLIPNSSPASSGSFLYADQYNRNFHLRFVEYNDHVDGDKLVSELKPSKPITHHPFHFYFDNWGILMMSSCNGLVFMGSTKPNYVNDMFICNPFTREYVNLRSKEEPQSQSQSQLERKGGGMSYGFGYLPSTNEYKIVRIYYPDLLEGKGKVSVYTLGSGRWRNKGEIPYWVYNMFHPGSFANGAIHWFTNTNTNRKKIVTFDLADEEFRMVVPLPPGAPSSNHVDKLGVLGGCLCVTRSDKTRCENPKEIWILNVYTQEEGKEKFSWNKRFSIPWKGTTAEAEEKVLWNKRLSIPWRGTTAEAEPHAILKSGNILLRGGTGLISYDPKTGAFSEGDGSISFTSMHKLIPYTKSFVSLKALGEEDAKCLGGFVSHALAQQQQLQLQG